MGFNPIDTLNALNNSKVRDDNIALYQCILNLINGLKDLFDSNQIDYGTGYLVSTDTNGTRVNFNKDFKSAVVIPIARVTTGDTYCTVYEVQNSYFTVFAYNNAGTRQSVVIDWIAYGIKS